MNARYCAPLDRLEVRALLVAARDDVATPGRWVSGYLALDKHGKLVSPRAREARQFCAWGALAKNDPSGTDHEEDPVGTGQMGELGVEALRVLDRAARLLNADSALVVNDLGTHRLVLRMFARAIALAGKPNP